MKKEIKPKVNMIANIINDHFLDSDYQGKDWEAVRKSLIKELSVLLAQEKQKLKWQLERDKRLMEEILKKLEETEVR